MSFGPFGIENLLLCPGVRDERVAEEPEDAADDGLTLLDRQPRHFMRRLSKMLQVGHQLGMLAPESVSRDAFDPHFRSSNRTRRGIPEGMVVARRSFPLVGHDSFEMSPRRRALSLNDEHTLLAVRKRLRDKPSSSYLHDSHLRRRGRRGDDVRGRCRRGGGEPRREGRGLSPSAVRI